ncbi:MAG: N-acetylmuramoyl-L-alanine amidase [Ruminococcaceae bacterium]|nr:N-acetylmuramoyl-L-alanine amidase [Oscillospiraceae bacterium]
MKIWIDAGHNYSGFDTGATGNGLREQDVTFYVADKLKGLLASAGHAVSMSRSSLKENVDGNSTSESLKMRAALSNTWGADLFLSIHCNAFNGTASGTETLVYSAKSAAYSTAKKVQKAIVSLLGTVDRGVKERPDLLVLKHTKAPALLVELAFIDNAGDAALLKNRQDDFARAIFEGVVGELGVKEETETKGQTVIQLPKEVYIQEIAPRDFSLVVCDAAKRSIGKNKYFNAGFFTTEQGGRTIPVGNLVCGGKVISQSKYNADWINVAKKKLTTIYTTDAGACGIIKTDTVSGLGAKEAVSGIPIIVGGKRVSLDEIKAEGYFGNELYDTWHGFLGIRHNKLVYVAMKCAFESMCWALVGLGIYDAIKLDGGGSFILKDGKELIGTNENRRIHNIGCWTK